MSDTTKTLRLHILMDPAFKAKVSQAAHDSWMSVGQYLRDAAMLFDGAKYDDAADLVMIGREVGLEGLEHLRTAAERRGITVRQLCESLDKKRPPESKPAVEDAAPEVAPDAMQVNLFGDS